MEEQLTLSIEIRHGRLTREEGIKLVERYDSKRPESLEKYLEFLEIKEEFFKLIDPMRDLSIWEKNGNNWILKDSVSNHIKNKFTEKARVVQKMTGYSMNQIKIFIIILIIHLKNLVPENGRNES